MENEQAWCVPFEEIRGRDYNLDIKNPHSEEASLGDPNELLSQYQAAQADLLKVQEQIKSVLNEALS